MKKFFALRSNKGVSAFTVVVTVIIFLILAWITLSDNSDYQQLPNNKQTAGLSNTNFNILISAENKDLESIILKYAKSKNYKLNIDYADTIEIMGKINNGEKYDAIWISNSIWSYMIDSKVASLKYSKSTSITPVIFGIKRSKAEELGFVGKTIYTKDIYSK